MTEELSEVPEGEAEFKAPPVSPGLSGENGKSLAFRKFKAEEEETPISAEISLEKFEQMLQQARNLVFVTDLDGTVLPFAKNPQDCRIYPKAKGALERIQNVGIPIVAMTGRSGADGAKMIEIPDAVIVGTAGWEVYRDGQSFVHEKFKPYAVQLTEFLRTVRNEFFGRMIGSSGDDQIQEITSQVATPDGSIIIEKKAVNTEFLEGLSQTYNLNQVDPDKWVELVQCARQIYERAVPEKLRKIFKFDPPADLGPDATTCGFSISPYGGEGKEKSLIQIMRSDTDINPHTGQPKREKYFRGLPGGFDGAVFFGDSDQDAKALRAAHLTAALAGKHSAGVVVFKSEVVGTSGQRRAIRYADVSTEGIEDNAELLTKIADLAEKYYQKAV